MSADLKPLEETTTAGSSAQQMKTSWLEDAFHNMSDGLAIFDANGILQFVNQRYRDLSPHIENMLECGKSHEAIIRATYQSGAVNVRGKSEQEFLDFATNERNAPSGQTIDQLMDGRWVRFSGRKLGDGSTVFVQTDITDLQNEQARRRAMGGELDLLSTQLQNVIESMFAGFIMFNEAQEVIICNSHYVEMFSFPKDFVKPGITRQALMDKAVEMNTFVGKQIESAQNLLNESAKNEDTYLSKYYLSNGRILQTRHTLTEEGGAILLFLDITREEGINDELERKNQQLARSNEELQSFAYVASHDLQEPLRKIEAFSDRLLKRYREDLDEKGQHYLDRMDSAATRMRKLINDLLGFSRVSSKETAFTPTDLNEVLEGVQSDLSITLEDRDATLHAQSLPVVEADPLQMSQLFQNLISNSLKFARKDVSPEINIEAELLSDPRSGHQEIQITFCDNGIGFDDRFKDQIFAVFQRLHGRDEYEGTGIGLATCRKIVERHNGTIQANGVDGEGATFVVALPVIQPIIEE